MVQWGSTVTNGGGYLVSYIGAVLIAVAPEQRCLWSCGVRVQVDTLDTLDTLKYSRVSAIETLGNYSVLQIRTVPPGLSICVPVVPPVNNSARFQAILGVLEHYPCANVSVMQQK